MSQHSALSRFSRLRMQEDGAPHRNVSALVLNIRDDGPAFPRGTRGGAPDRQCAPAGAALPQEPISMSAPARGKASGWKAAFFCCFLLGMALGGSLACYAWTLRQDVALLETTLSALARQSPLPGLLGLNPTLAR